MKLCECGCGQECKNRFVFNHHGRKGPVDYVVEDRGYTTPCWIWQRKLNHYGYGVCSRDNKDWLAHVWYYVQTKGPVPVGLQLDHLCRQRACVNYDHVEPVTSAVNIQRGNQTPFTESDIADIHARYLNGESQYQIAKIYGVHQPTISRILIGQRWAGVQQPTATRSPVKLSQEQAEHIRSLCKAGNSQRDVAVLFGMGQTQISRIVRGESWRGEVAI